LATIWQQFGNMPKSLISNDLHSQMLGMHFLKIILMAGVSWLRALQEHRPTLSPGDAYPRSIRCRRGRMRLDRQAGQRHKRRYRVATRPSCMLVIQTHYYY
jgi:hypothetical protein